MSVRMFPLLGYLLSISMSGCISIAEQTPSNQTLTTHRHTPHTEAKTDPENRTSCAALELAKHYAIEKTAPSTLKWLGIQECCGPSVTRTNHACSFGTHAGNKQWYENLPLALLSGSARSAEWKTDAGIARCAVNSQPVLTVSRNPSNQYVIELPSALPKGVWFARVLEDDQIRLIAFETKGERTQIVLSKKAQTIELLSTLDGRVVPYAEFPLARSSICPSGNKAKVKNKLEAEAIMNEFNRFRGSKGVKRLTLDTALTQPLESWIRREAEMKAHRDIPGVLDSRGWRLPHQKLVRLSAHSTEDVSALMVSLPRLREALLDPSMDRVSFARTAIQDPPELLILFWASGTDLEILNKSFLDELARQRQAFGLPILKQTTQSSDDVSSMECVDAIETLKTQIKRPQVHSIWVKTSLHHTSDLGVPTCQLQYQLSPPDETDTDHP